MIDRFDSESAFTHWSARRDGFSRRDLDSRLLERPFHGVRSVRHVHTDLDEDSGPGERQRAEIALAAGRFTTLMADHEFFSHTTAAILWGIPLPMLADTAVHVSATAPHAGPRGSGVSGHQLAPRTVSVINHPESGWAVTSPAATWALLGSMIRHPYDLVAAADAIVRVDRVAGPHGRVKRSALASVADLTSAVPAKRRGVVALREALPRVRAGAASRPETWVRLTLVDGGLPEPRTDVDVYDDLGRFIGCLDLAYPGLKIAIEYEGDHHRTARVQWNRDLEKYDALAEAGWRVIRVTARVLFDEPERLIATVRSALQGRS